MIDARKKQAKWLPTGLEYIKLKEDLEKRMNEKYNLDNHKYEFVDSHLTPVLISGQLPVGVFDEPNEKPAYPDSTIPYSQGEVWEES